MKVLVRISFVLVSCFAVSFSAHSQGNDVLLKAMQDELDRNMQELKLPGFDNPFFIMYGVRDQKTYSISAVLGAISESQEIPLRLKTASRVLVGGYEFNDESLEDNMFSPPTAREIELPLDNDYLGIRRAFWSTTDKVYRDAARHFQKHQQTLKESGKKLSEIPHRSFAKSDPVKIIETMKSFSFDRKAWEEKARNLSALFLKHSFVDNSGVLIQFEEGYDYLVNTEGTMARIPFARTTFMAVCQTKSESGEFGMDRVLHVVRTPDQLPTEHQLRDEIEAMIVKVKNMADTPKFGEEYTGPVLIMGPVVAEVLSTVLFASRESIMANDHIRKLTGYQYDNDVTSMDGKIGKPILNEAITIKAKPKLKSFNGVELLGSFSIDGEGIVPADEVVLVEKGILKNLMNNRTITNPSQQANGFDAGPGVLEITMAYQDSEKTLKDKLIAKAKAEGLEYAYIIREASALGMGLKNVFRVSVADGKEELIKNALMETNGFKTFKRMMGASAKYQAHNLGGDDPNQGGALISFIVPEAILLEEMVIKPFPMPTLKEEQYVSNPLGW
jgi:hypothetical protein